ncbi:cell surface A33 antigen-like [Betta splendens]|uniref:Cell surface A33 antigen-like n=1 Tax=Betta splendens TaxID=158456 RepID=A0A6P7LE59_BETSP|nr:cell surface A33 antigen-like [Betta splendens]
MTTHSQLVWRGLLLVVTVLPTCSSLEVSIPVKEYEAASGGEIAMTCNFNPAKPDVKALVLKWEALPDKIDGTTQTVATYYSSPVVDIAPPYEGRTSLVVDIQKKVSVLTLTKLTMQDNRRYQCNVLIPNDDEGTTIAGTSLLVLVPPSKPLCQLQGKAEYWYNVTLTCMSQEGSPQPVYEWMSYNVQNVHRPFPPKTTQKDGVLSLFNISSETSGFFICTSTNRIGSASCNFTLAVMPSSMNIASTGIIIGVVVAGVLVIGIIICCCCRRRSKKNKYAEGSPGEMEFSDQHVSEPEKPYRDDNTKELKEYEDKDVASQSIFTIPTPGHMFDDDRHSAISSTHDGKASDMDSQPYRDRFDDRYGGSRDRLDDNRDRYGGSRDRLDDNRDRYGGSRDRLDDNRDRYGGSRDRLDDNRDRYGGSRDRLDDNRDRYGGSRDRLDDNRDRYGGSRDRLDDNRDRYGGSRDRLDDNRDRYGGSRDRLDDNRDRYGGSRDRLDDRRDRYGGSRDRLD